MSTPHTLHEWRERAEDGDHRFNRAWRGKGKWHFLTTLKSEPDWMPVDDPDLDFLTALREKLFDKYQRRRVPWEQVQEIDKMIEAKGGTPGAGAESPETIGEDDEF
jgi:hypothetical protein